jgi:hypothetical protein
MAAKRVSTTANMGTTIKYMKHHTVRAITSTAACLSLAFLAIGCANMSTGVGISFPIGPFGSIGVGAGSDGRVGASVGVGVGPATVSVGTSGTLPQSQKTESAPKPAPVANSEEEKKQ